MDKQNFSNNTRCSSEADLRATSVRAEIEKRIDEIQNSVLQNDVDLNDSVQSLEVKSSRSCSVSELKESVISHLQEELDQAQKELKLKDEKVITLTKIRDKIGDEIEELTASLFEEANKMVQEAKGKQAKAEKHAKEADMKLSVLQEELAALKSFIGSTMPYTNSPLRRVVDEKKSIFSFKSPSLTQNQAQHFHPLKNPELSKMSIQNPDYDHQSSSVYKREQYEPDPILHREFVSWRQNPIVDKNNPFVQRIYTEDINLCMNFENKELAERVLQAIETNTFAMESISPNCKIPKRCALLSAPRFCHYVITLGGTDHYYVSSLSRNRIAAICELLCFLTYIQKGLVDKNVHDTYLELLRKRKAIAIARLGLPEANDI